MDRRTNADSHIAWVISMVAVWFAAAIISYGLAQFTITYKLATWLSLVCVLTVLVAVSIYCIKHGILHGIRYMRIHSRLCKSVRRALLTAKVYTRYSLVFRSAPVLQDFRLSFSDDLQFGKLRIRLDPSLCDKLDNLDLSSALDSYIVADTVTDNEGNWICFNLVNAAADVRLHFMTPRDFFDYFRHHHTDLLFVIDKRTIIDIAHFLITGGTGQGKTYFLGTLIAQSATWSDGMRPIYLFADGKLSGLRKIGRALGIHVETDLEKVSLMLVKVCTLMMDRYRKRDQLDCDGLDGDAWLDSQPPAICIIDEAAAYLDYVGTLPAAERRSTLKQLTDITRLGREAKCFLWLVMQTAKADTVPTDIRSNCSFRCVLGPGKDTMYQTIFGSGQDIPKNRIIPTGGGYYIDDGKTLHPMSLICPTVDFDIAKALRDANIHFVDGNDDAAVGRSAAGGGTV